VVELVVQVLVVMLEVTEGQAVAVLQQQAELLLAEMELQVKGIMVAAVLVIHLLIF
jgi:hypothetical protein